MTNKITLKGYDTAGEADLLGRKRLAKQIFDLIQNTDPNWSIRIGIYGKWGSGKTTILNYISNLAEESGYPVITIAPWDCGSLSKFKEKFRNELLTNSLIKAYKDPIRLKLCKKLKDFRKKLTSFDYKDRSSYLAPIRNASEYTELIFNPSSLMSEKTLKLALKKAADFISIDDKELASIQQDLNSNKKRIIVAIDDLDRIDPNLLPNLLLSLSEVLDLPGFSFLLPFDRDIVAESLKTYHPAYGTGHEFLEKIIDYPFFLDAPTNNQKKDLFIKNLAVLVKDVEPSTWNELYKHLPTNPRKIKGIIRQIHMIKAEISRHDKVTLNWALIFFIAIIKQISPDFLGKLKKVLENYNVLSSDKKTQKSDEELEVLPKKTDEEIEVSLKETDEELEVSLKETSDISPEQKIELKELVKACFNHIGQYTLGSLIYHFNLLDRPPLVTWKEFNELFLKWKTTNKKTTVTQEWIKYQSQKRHISIDEIADALFEKIVIYRDNLLEDASNTYTLEEQHCRLIEEGHELLKLIEQLAKHGLSKNEKTYFQRYSYFYKYLKMLENWIHFDDNKTDQETREREKKLLLYWLKLLSLEDLNEAYLYFSEQLRKIPSTDRNYDTKRKALYSECLKICSPVIFEELLDSFRQKNKIALMRQQENPELSILLDHQSKFFSSPYQDAFYKLLEEGKSNTIIQSNFIDYLSLIATREHTIKEAASLVQNKKEVIVKLWQTVISKELQFRILNEVREDREKLLEWGMDEKDLPMPPWLSLKD